MAELERVNSKLELLGASYIFTDEGVKCYSDHTVLPRVLNYPEGVIKIASENLSNTEGVEEIILSESVVGLDKRAFYVQPRLRNIQFNRNIRHLESQSVQCTGIEKLDLSMCINLRKIDRYAFKACINLKEVILGEGIEIIEEEAFHMCDNLERVDFSRCVRLSKIYCKAFEGCTKLKELDLSKCVKLRCIGDFAFKDCIGLDAIKIPKYCTDIMLGAFFSESKTNLKYLEIPYSSAVSLCTELGNTKKVDYNILGIALNDGYKHKDMLIYEDKDMKINPIIRFIKKIIHFRL